MALSGILLIDAILGAVAYTGLFYIWNVLTGRIK